MWIVVGVVVAALIIFFVFRALSAPRSPMVSRPPQPYYDPVPMVEPVYVDPDPIGGIATAFAAEAVIDTVIGVADSFDSGPADFCDPGSGSGSDFGGSGF